MSEAARAASAYPSSCDGNDIHDSPLINPIISSPAEEDAVSSRSSATLISVEYIQYMWLMRAVGRTVLAPLDRVKYIMQCQMELQRTGVLRGELRNSWSCVRHLLRVEGRASFWRGNLIQVISLLPIALAQVFIAAPTQSFVFDAVPKHSAVGWTVASYAALLSGAVAASMISYPLDFARFRLAVDVKAYKGQPYEFRHSLAFFSNRVLNECPHYLYKGLTLYIVGSIVYQSVHNVLLSIIAPYVPPEDPNEVKLKPIVIQSLCGLTVAGVSTLCLHPVDLVRRRMMIAVTNDRLRYPSALNCVTQIMMKEGIRGFYRGAMITLARTVVATGLVLVGLPY